MCRPFDFGSIVGMTPTDAHGEAAKTVDPTKVRVPRSPAVAAWIALLVGLASACVSAYWGFGGERLLDTVGGAFERLGRSGTGGAVVLLSIVVVVKVIAAVLPMLAIRPVGTSAAHTPSRLGRGVHPHRLWLGVHRGRASD